MNLIVSFDSPEQRDSLVARIRRQAPELLDHGYLAKRRPDMVFESLTEEQASVLKTLVGGLGRSFEDIQFRSTGPR